MDRENDFLQGLTIINAMDLTLIKPIGAGRNNRVSLCELKENEGKRNVAVKTVNLNETQAKS